VATNKALPKNPAAKAPLLKPLPRVTAHNDGRTALIEAAIIEMSKDGPALVQPNELCIRLGLSKSLVNFHFGGRDGLIAEALTISYERYVEELIAAPDTAGPDPIDRILTWADRQIDWTIENPGIACGLNFFKQGSSTHGALSPELRARMTAAGEANLRNMFQLVIDARRKLHGDDYEDDPMFASHTASTIGWLTMGEAVWLGGRHVPSNESDEVAKLFPLAREFVRGAVVALLERKPEA
jgi:AcrR family transcriptional regulator